jgi:hypothetical protein
VLRATLKMPEFDNQKKISKSVCQAYFYIYHLVKLSEKFQDRLSVVSLREEFILINKMSRKQNGKKIKMEKLRSKMAKKLLRFQN